MNNTTVMKKGIRLIGGICGSNEWTVGIVFPLFEIPDSGRFKFPKTYATEKHAVIFNADSETGRASINILWRDDLT